MYTQQARTGVPELDAVLATAQMVTPDKTPTVAAQVAQAAQQKMQPQGIMQGMQGPQGMQGAKQDYAAAAPSMMRNMQQQQMQQMVQQAMQPKPAGIEGLPSNIQMAEGGVVGYAGKDGSLVGSEEELEVLREKIRDEFENLASPLNILGPRAGQERQRAQDIIRMLPSLEKEQMRNILGMTQRPGNTAAYQEFGPGERAEQASSQAETPRAPERTAAPPIAASSAGRALAQNINTPTQFNIDPNNPQALNALRRAAMEAGGVERQALMNKIAEIEISQANRSTAPEAPAPTGVAALAEQPKMNLSRYEKAGAEDRASIGKIIADQEANAAAKAAYMSGRPKFEQEGIAALTKANQAREELLSKERADDAYNRQQALLDQIGRRNTSAYSQEQGRQRQRDLSAAEAQRLYEQAVIKQREAEFLQGAGRFEEAKKALDDKEKILAAMQTRINQSRQTAAGIDEREFTNAVQMYEGAQNRANSIEVERMRRATTDRPGETERILAEFNRLKARDPAAAEQYLQDLERVKGSGRGLDLKETSVELRALKDEEQQYLKRLETALTDAQRKPIEAKLEEIIRRRQVLMGGSPAPTQLPPAALAQLKEGIATTFANGQQWTLKNGQPTQVK